jgi:hypothetical protein
VPGKKVRLRGDLDAFEVELDGKRKIVKVTKDGKTVICEETQFGLICDPALGPGAGNGAGPALQLRVSKTGKSLFARAMPENSGQFESAVRTGFQRHGV